MAATLRHHGATVVERHGRPVAAHFGSPTAEAAACRSSAGLAERSDRATLAIRGPAAEIDRALGELAALGDHAWWVRRSPQQAIVRCEGADAGSSTSVLLRAEVRVVDLSEEHAALDVIGPRAEEVVRAAGVEQEGGPVVVVRRGPACVELLIGRSHGPELYHRLLRAGAPFGLTCVGLDALEHLEVSDHLVRRRVGS